MTDSRNITTIFISSIVILFAVWLGVSLVTDQLQTLIYASSLGTLLICLLLGRKIWLILPFAGALNLSLMIPGQPNTLMIAQALFIGFCGLQFLMRRLPFRIQITELEVWIILVTLCVVQAYARAPVSLNILGGDSVGGRPYFLFGLTLVTASILATLRVYPNDLRWVFRLSVIGGLLNLGLSTIGYFVPRLGVWIGTVGISSLSHAIEQGNYGETRATRIVFLGAASQNIALWISSLRSPIRACLHPIWAPLVLLSLGFAAFSGFRSQLAMIGLTYIMGIAYHGGIRQFFVACVAFVMGVTLLAFSNTVVPLPSNIQRALSFLPGTWDEELQTDAENSTQWRVDMWEAALFTDNWIQNKFLGDGLGMSLQEFNFIQANKDNAGGGLARAGKLTLQQELMMAAGNYHSGPVSTVRAIGYLGLVILLLAQIRLAIHAHRQIRRTRGTAWFGLSLLIGIPIIWSPIFFVFIFGDIGPAISTYLMGAGMIRLLENNLSTRQNQIDETA